MSKKTPQNCSEFKLKKVFYLSVFDKVKYSVFKKAKYFSKTTNIKKLYQIASLILPNTS